ncbi:SIR2 family NAD-dependent protein deacylase [Clostridium butyricum]|uniref:SIR2 family NAD-dependent protein deacylase n=1 Tax=Clostridium TaxID=1485 RepID=UPI001FA7F2E5|nr:MULTISPECIES: SIR2 family protein [Clostridium]
MGKDKAMDFQEIMAFNAPYNQRNFDALIEKITLNQVVPYIGAGMSILFDGVYLSWGEFLNKTFEEFVNPSEKEKFDKLNYEDKADFLYEEMGKISFADNLKKTFGQHHLEKDISNFRDKSMYLLPEIFEKGLLITTNYDKVIEKSYILHSKSLGVSHPGHFEALNSALRDSELMLYKIHGDITEPIDSIILTKAQYESAYSNQQLVETLKQIYVSKSMLFLGCSLEKDRPIRLLCEVSRSGMTNYAIIGCKNESKKEKRVQLENEYFTQAIIYPDGKHECLRTILEEIIRVIKSKKEEARSLSLLQAKVKDIGNEGGESKAKVEDINNIYKVKVCTEIKRLLIENYRIFKDYGPKSEIAKKNPWSSAYNIWECRKKEKMIPNNEAIVNIIEDNKELFTITEYEVCYEFIEHANGFKKSCEQPMEDVKQFPEKFNEVINKYAKV